MATNDKHCQTFCVTEKVANVANEEVSFTKSYYKGMYDETVEVNDIESPPTSDDEGVVRSAMSKFMPPQRPARHDFDSDSDSATDGDGDRFLGNVAAEDQSPERKVSPREAAQAQSRARPRSGARRDRPHSAVSRRQLSSNSDEDTDSADLDPSAPAPLGSKKRTAGVVIPPEGAYDPTQFQGLKVPPEIEACFQYILKYTPQKIEIPLKLQPFLPEYVPAVGDPDAMLKVTTPASNARAEPLAERVLEHIDNLGVTVLDEPTSEQSDAALLHLQLRAVARTQGPKATVLTKKIEDAEKNPKAIDRWIKDISELHLSKPAPTVTYTTKMPDIDSLMEEWPEEVERALSQGGVPPAAADCSLTEYADLLCALTDVPRPADSLTARLQALHLLFSLYSAVKSSQLYADREKEKENG